jgi:hypothetical protein
MDRSEGMEKLVLGVQAVGVQRDDFHVHFSLTSTRVHGWIRRLLVVRKVEIERLETCCC